MDKSDNNNEESKSKFPTHVFLPSFLNKEMPIGTFFITAGALSAVGFGLGLLIGFRKTGGIRQTIRTSPPGVVLTATKALLGGTAICAGFTTALVYFLKYQYNIQTVKDFGDLMRGKQDVKENITLIDEETYLAQLNNRNNNNSNSNDNTDLDKMDKESLEALRALKFLPFDFESNNNNNNNNNSNNNNNNNNNQNQANNNDNNNSNDKW